MKYCNWQIGLLCLPLLCALPSAPSAADEVPSKEKETPLHALPYTPSLDLAAMDRTANPCEDFYQYTCGGWLKNNPIPAHRASWSVYGKLQDDNERFLWGLLEEAARPDPGRDAPRQKTGDYFASCMDEAAIEKAGATPLAADLKQLAAIGQKSELWPFIARQHLLGLDGGMLFGFTSQQDPGESSQVIAAALAGGLGLPDRDYYVKPDQKSQEIREQYQAHVRRMLELLGDAPADSKPAADTVLAIETELAKATLTRVEQRDPYKLYHKMKVAELAALSPIIDWGVYLKGIGADKLDSVNVSQPAFFKKVHEILSARPLADWKTYLRWQMVRGLAPYLSTPFVMANFDFYAKTLRGVQKIEPRWQRCVQWVDRDLGEALGKVYVERTFGPKTRPYTLDMVQKIEAAMESEIKQLPWMGDKTREQALTKLHAIVNKIGHPERWRDYGAVQVQRRDFAGNVGRAQAFELHRELLKIGKPVDRGEWQMTPPSVNAYYDAQLNDMNFPAGVLQPPLLDLKLDDAPNYGNTGGTIGHELTHGFDDEGRQYDAHGNLRDWWSKQDAARFQQQAQCVVDQYAKYIIVDDIHINSKLTLGEDVADLGGTLLAYLAWKQTPRAAGSRKPETKPEAKIDGMTPDQRFFVGYAQWACENQRVENERLMAVVNVHSPGKYRVNGVVANLPQFWAAFQCKPGQAMVRAKPCSVW